MTVLDSPILRFHLAMPVDDLTSARQFYGAVLGLEEGRSAETWVDWNLHGHQFVTHLAAERAARAVPHADRAGSKGPCEGPLPGGPVVGHGRRLPLEAGCPGPAPSSSARIGRPSTPKPEGVSSSSTHTCCDVSNVGFDRRKLTHQRAEGRTPKNREPAFCVPPGALPWASAASSAAEALTGRPASAPPGPRSTLRTIPASSSCPAVAAGLALLPAFATRGLTLRRPVARPARLAKVTVRPAIHVLVPVPAAPADQHPHNGCPFRD
ncbi:hypothetical protein GA0115254_12018 [Streptomyces sp. Ncost-T10-10d]|nr:hypothetical protein GA0115254_12018 [Streptomyces sp. Ncost-T10-10d]